MAELTATVILNNYTGYDWQLSSCHTTESTTLASKETDRSNLPSTLKKTERLVIEVQVDVNAQNRMCNDTVRASIQYSILNELKPHTIIALDILCHYANESIQCEVGFLFRSDPDYQFLGSARIEESATLPQSTVSIYGQTLSRRHRTGSEPWRAPN